MVKYGVMGIAYKNKWTEDYIFTLNFNRFIDYLDYLFPREEEKTVEQKKKESMDYFQKRKKTFSDIMGRVKKMKKEKETI